MNTRRLGWDPSVEPFGGVGFEPIARRLGLARNARRAALIADVPPRVERKRAGSRLDEFEPRIRLLLKEFPTMPASVIAERVGWGHSASVIAERVEWGAFGVVVAGSAGVAAAAVFRC
ncbi:hypothetical protein EH165_06070 [Nakamurella antarctica]|uniref:Transposase n=1 Tax=Nakamurella antarctica TaxID=1902245 RepID=A0A3G8ZLX3_9ACTN|nr:hypothetical protein [Nakamurella antarctica]AZI57777.1 hypothetical protein EH165_06070 [Nakamurella antarctica]